jgi:hypothetical protein
MATHQITITADHFRIQAVVEQLKKLVSETKVRRSSFAWCAGGTCGWPPLSLPTAPLYAVARLLHGCLCLCGSLCIQWNYLCKPVHTVESLPPLLPRQTCLPARLCTVCAVCACMRPPPPPPSMPPTPLAGWSDPSSGDHRDQSNMPTACTSNRTRAYLWCGPQLANGLHHGFCHNPRRLYNHNHCTLSAVLSSLCCGADCCG